MVTFNTLKTDSRVYSRETDSRSEYKTQSVPNTRTSHLLLFREKNRCLFLDYKATQPQPRFVNKIWSYGFV
jgi:hypothetical protein